MRANQIKYVFFTLICMCVAPLITRAECDYQRQAELLRIASNVQFSYNYNMNEGLTFTLYVNNLTDDIYVVDSYGQRLSGAGEKQLIYSPSRVSGFQSGDQVRFEIYSNDSNCPSNLLITKYVNFPIFNPYSNLDECKQNPNFKYCQIWVDTSSVTYEQFTSELNSTKNQPTEEAEEIKQNIFEKILSVLARPQTMIVGLILLIIVLISLFIYILKRKKYKGR